MTTRRQFLKLAGAALGGTALACSGLTYLGTLTPNPKTIQTNCGGKSNMDGRILIVYASKCGSTGEVAQAIGRTLCDMGATVDVRPVKAVTSVDGYHAIVVGSAIRMGQWLPEAKGFVTKHQVQLRQMPTAFFTVHMLNVDDSPESRAARATYVAPVHQLVPPSAGAFFTGKIELARMSLFDRLIASAMKAKDEDLRDWTNIGAWARGVAPTLGIANLQK
jgi:menaquinone-dependent protoporphyrinogen oxidase